MITLTPSTAITLVRKNLDEAGLNESVMYTDENNDNLSLDDLVKKNLPEAINAVHLTAPVNLLEGAAYTFTRVSSKPEGESVSVSADGVVSFSPSKKSNLLRLVAFRAKDSAIVVTDTIPEASAEGRKQLNKTIRGRYDRPRLVRMQGETTPPSFKYYTLKTGTIDTLLHPSDAIALFSFIPEQFYSPQSTGYEISRLLRQNIIDRLTAMVMETYGNQSAQAFYDRSNSY